MSDPVRITVAVATLDRPDGLRRCLDALLAGSLAPREILVVDQGDHDRTAAVLEAFERASPPIRHVRQSVRGLSASRNAAIRCCRDGVIAVTDDDCRPDARWVEEIVRAFAENPDAGAVCGRVLADGTPQDGEPVSLRASARTTVFQGRVRPWLVGTGGNFAGRRDLLITAGGYDERLGAGSPGRAAEDLDVIHRLLRRGAPIVYEPDAVVFHARAAPERVQGSLQAYGYGIGAMCGIWLRRGEAWMLTVLVRWFEMRLRRVKNAPRGEWARRCRAEGRILRATLRGLLYGVTRHPRPDRRIGRSGEGR